MILWLKKNVNTHVMLGRGDSYFGQSWNDDSKCPSSVEAKQINQPNQHERRALMNFVYIFRSLRFVSFGSSSVVVAAPRFIYICCVSSLVVASLGVVVVVVVLPILFVVPFVATSSSSSFAVPACSHIHSAYIHGIPYHIGSSWSERHIKRSYKGIWMLFLLLPPKCTSSHCESCRTSH